MRHLLYSLCLLFAISATAQTDVVISFDHDGETREFELHIPTGYDANQTYPLVVNMHGLGGDRASQRFYSQMNLVADTAKFLVAYPQGLEVNFQGRVQRHWNAQFGTGVDDVGFISRLIDTVGARYSMDEERVYATGMSNGGYMSYYLACEITDKLTAVASVTGSMTGFLVNSCDPSETIPAMQIHGTADAVVTFNGPPSIDDVVDFWVDHNTCGMTPQVEMIPDIDMGDGCTAERRVYSDCDSDAEVWYYVIDNGGHTWPGTFPVPALGNTCNDFFASTEVWKFFNLFPKTTTSTDQSIDPTIAVSPNPVLSHFEVNDPKVNSVILTNVQGQSIEVKKTTAGFSIGNLPPGLYVGRSGKARFSLVKI